jgi:hypothetical protein
MCRAGRGIPRTSWFAYVYEITNQERRTRCQQPRGLLLQVTRRIGGNCFGMLWTALVFGSMHPFGWFALGVALTTWILAWAILRAGSLWAGYILHQGLDFFMDSLLH